MIIILIGSVFGVLLLCCLVFLLLLLLLAVFLYRRKGNKYTRYMTPLLSLTLLHTIFTSSLSDWIRCGWLTGRISKSINKSVPEQTALFTMVNLPLPRLSHFLSRFANLLLFALLATWKGVEVAVKLLGANIVGDEANNEVTTAVPITKQLQNQFVDEATLMTTLRHPVWANSILFDSSNTHLYIERSVVHGCLR